MSDSKISLKSFVGGLNTEQSNTEELLAFTSDELNCSIYPEGIRGRRFGMNIERDGSLFQLSKAGSTYSGFFWKNVGKTSTDFVVYQVDNKLYFYEASVKPFSNFKLNTFVDLSNYIVDINNFYNFPVNFSTGNGKLIVVSKYMKAIIISYNFDKTKFEVEELVLKYRDIEGVKDNLEIDEQPINLSNEHKYNLLNQGWSIQDIEQFHKDKQRYPSNNLQWFLGKDASGNYNTEKLLKTYFGNTPAPKGHFILDYFNRDRASASGIFKGTERTAAYSYASGWVSGRSLYYNPCYSFSIVIPSSGGTSKSLRIKFSKIQRKVAKKAWGNYVGKVLIEVYGLTAKGSWTNIYSDTHVFEGPGEYLLNYPKNVTKYEQYKAVISFKPGTDWWEAYPGSVIATVGLSIAEDGNPFPYTHGLDRVTDITYMSGKYFYLTGDTVLFSQTVAEDNTGVENCYQFADPTSEEISDVVPTDGGYVKFQTMGEGLALKTFNRGVLVFGRDVVYGLISPLDGRFTATEYDTVELSRAGLIGTKTVVSIANSVYYWSPLGIFRIGVNQQSGNTLTAESISQNTIQSFYNNIQQFSKEHCKAAFDYANNRIYWFYPTDERALYKLDGVLMYDLNYGAFCPFKISKGGAVTAVFETIDNYEIEPTLYLRAGGRRVVAGKQFVIAKEQENVYNRYVAIQHCIITDDNKISFGDFNSREFLDWDKSQYDSYMVSRPIMLESSTASGTYDNKQVPIMQTLFKRTEEEKMNADKKYIASSGAYIRMRWGWSLSDNSNRWDLIQNAYRPQKDFLYDEYVESRIHIRGRGKVYQIEVRNDSNKDFKLANINLLVRK